jgi:putative membrane protein
MSVIAAVLVVLVAVLHAWFLVLEMFLWTRPAGLKTFRNTPEKAETTRVLAANQGLYNGFLAAGLLWGLVTAQWNVVVFFLLCVVVAALYGAWSVSQADLLRAGRAGDRGVGGDLAALRNATAGAT